MIENEVANIMSRIVDCENAVRTTLTESQEIIEESQTRMTYFNEQLRELRKAMEEMKANVKDIKEDAESTDTAIQEVMRMLTPKLTKEDIED
eukprot:g16501.t1